jgi:hypothetical protein
MPDSSPLGQFLDYLNGHGALRQTLKDALLEDIVAEGAKRGFFFSVEDLRDSLNKSSKPTTGPIGGSEWQAPGQGE